MLQGFRFAAVTAVLFVAACAPDTTSVSRPGPIGGTGARAATTAAEATPATISILPNEVVGGTATSTIRVDVDAAVACCDRTMQVTSNNPTVLPFLSSATTVSAGATFAAVQLLPATVSQQRIVTVSVTGNSVTRSIDLIVDPPGTPPPAPTLSSYTVTPATVNAGTTAIGTVTIPSPAPSGGLVVTLSSRQPGTASVPASVTVPPGATSVSFPITTFVGFPNSTTVVRLFAQNVNTIVEGDIGVVTGGTTSTSTSLAAPALLTPSADQRFAPGSSLTFDWTDVAGAASYEIQIDDRDTFPAPLTVDASVTASQFSTRALPTSTLFWRVRGRSSSGAAGAWSQVRRFELKN
jgi:hypothetical protein